MPALDNLLRLNGVPISDTSTRSRINGATFVGIREVDIADSREGELVHAQQPDATPVGITSGLYKVDTFNFKALIDTGEQIKQFLAAGAAAGSFGDARFTFQLEIGEPLGPTMMLTINGCKIEKQKTGRGIGAAALVYEFECKALTLQTRGAGPGGLNGFISQLYSLQRATLGL